MTSGLEASSAGGCNLWPTEGSGSHGPAKLVPPCFSEHLLPPPSPRVSALPCPWFMAVRTQLPFRPPGLSAKARRVQSHLELVQNVLVLRLGSSYCCSVFSRNLTIYLMKDLKKDLPSRGCSHRERTLGIVTEHCVGPLSALCMARRRQEMTRASIVPVQWRRVKSMPGPMSQWLPG